MAFSHKSISRHKKLTAGVKKSSSRNNYPRGGPGKEFKKFSQKSLTVPKMNQFAILIDCRTHWASARNR